MKSAAMKTARRSRAVAATGLELEAGACSVCKRRGVCAAATGIEEQLRLCFLCALSAAQLVASASRANQRPHSRASGCHCEACVVFDEGQRGEIANRELLVDSASKSRWAQLEVDR
jgi:hypothetical protein